MEAFTKVVRPGTTLVSGINRHVFCSIKWDGTKLSITGVVGPLDSGNAYGSCGQIVPTRIEKLAPEWTRAMVQEFWNVWLAWHLNDMQAGCEHQRAGVAAYDDDPLDGTPWGKRPIDDTKPTDVYGRHFEGQSHDSWNMLGWVRPDEHPQGLLTRACPVCGYKYGTRWLTMEVPEEVLVWLHDLPDTDKEPAWV